MNKSRMRRLGAGLLGATALILTTSFATPVLAAGSDSASKPVQTQAMGKVTKRPIPRYVSMKASEGNVRRGPSLSHRIDWVFKRRDMPRTVLIEKDMLTLHARPMAKAPVTAALEMGVVARVSECAQEWCLLRSGGFKGWAPKARLWGVRTTEEFD